MKKIGLILMTLGIFLVIIQPTAPITGAVIDLSTPISKINLFIGGILIIIGMLILIWKK
jgi:nitrate reductase gamma subunit